MKIHPYLGYSDISVEILIRDPTIPPPTYDKAMRMFDINMNIMALLDRVGITWCSVYYYNGVNAEYISRNYIDNMVLTHKTCCTIEFPWGKIVWDVPKAYKLASRIPMAWLYDHRHDLHEYGIIRK